ncbi:MAG: shikimate kinase [Chitinophagaceae bacterium]|nr:shikimate kinase [Chitinophagaceae bacterium]
MRIFLLGYMGTGKTYWGKLWAAQNGMNFFDLDHEIEQNAGMTIREMFEKHGENFFRQKEKEALHLFVDEDNFILSTGGGTPCFFDNMQWMNDKGITVYLNASASILAERLLKEKDHRPLIKNLTNEELIPFIENNINKRNKFYTQSRVILDTEKIANNTFDEIIRKYV